MVGSWKTPWRACAGSVIGGAAARGRVAGVATRKAGEGGGRRESAGRAGRGRPGPEAPETREAPSGAGRARDMVMVDPWGTLLGRLLEPPEEDREEPTEAGPTPGKGAADKG